MHQEFPYRYQRTLSSTPLRTNRDRPFGFKLQLLPTTTIGVVVISSAIVAPDKHDNNCYPFDSRHR